MPIRFIWLVQFMHFMNIPTASVPAEGGKAPKYGSNYLENYWKSYYLCRADRNAEARFWAMRVGRQTFFRCVYSTLFLDKRKSGKFSIFVKNVANSRCLVDMLMIP